MSCGSDGVKKFEVVAESGSGFVRERVIRKMIEAEADASKFSIRGRIWVDGEDFAIARIEGQPAKNPSLWIRSVQVEQRYGRAGQFWLPASNQALV